MNTPPEDLTEVANRAVAEEKQRRKLSFRQSLALQVQKFRWATIKKQITKDKPRWDDCWHCRNRFQPEYDESKAFPADVVAFDRTRYCSEVCARPAPATDSRISRQVKRHYLRGQAVKQVNDQVPSATRRSRREMGRLLANKWRDEQAKAATA